MIKSRILTRKLREFSNLRRLSVNEKPSIFPEIYRPLDEVKSSDKIKNASDEGALDENLLTLLEELSLVRFSNPAAVHHLRKAINYANHLDLVDTRNVEPMYTVLENEELRLREDMVTEGNVRDEILRNASKRVEEYFVAPTGNIPLQKDENPLTITLVKQLAKKSKKNI
uniref:Glutamyl-tRNA(Gln) amidotransferase subunit C, mitochondrial n=1 Tax=Romanomermis culicivorax TaxID=13658 RepID=A0A915KN68_ROMCU